MESYCDDITEAIEESIIEDSHREYNEFLDREMNILLSKWYKTCILSIPGDGNCLLYSIYINMLRLQIPEAIDVFEVVFPINSCIDIVFLKDWFKSYLKRQDADVDDIIQELNQKDQPMLTDDILMMICRILAADIRIRIVDVDSNGNFYHNRLEFRRVHELFQIYPCRKMFFSFGNNHWNPVLSNFDFMDKDKVVRMLRCIDLSHEALTLKRKREDEESERLVSMYYK